MSFFSKCLYIKQKNGIIVWRIIMKENGTELYNLIGSNIKKLRKSKKLGQEDLAKLISLSRSSLSNIEIGKHQPSVFTIYEIASALNCSLDKILPSIKDYNSIASGIDEEYEEILEKYKKSISMSAKDIIILKEIIQEDD